MTKEQEEKQAALTLKIYKEVFAFLGGDPNTVELPEHSDAVNVALVKWNEVDMAMAFSALGSVLCGLILADDNPHARYDWFVKNLVDDLDRHYHKTMGAGETRQ